ncbi:MAG: YceH family protein [Planctomycetes bacterium]|nr:YceH family protein [Planctomycetota bacterium]
MPRALSFAERRVLGVLIEKGFTTPQQYPLTINALVAGCNQQSCREPVADLGDSSVLDALDSLREKGLVTLVRTTGGRTDRFKHNAAGGFDIEGPQLAVLAELLLRGPQTDGELRQRASRMVPIADLAALQNTLASLQSRDDPLVRRLSPPQRRRGVRYAHALYPPDEEPALEDLDEREDLSASPRDAAAPRDAVGSAGAEGRASPPRGDSARMLQRLEVLERRIEDIEDRLERIESACPELRKADGEAEGVAETEA